MRENDNRFEVTEADVDRCLSYVKGLLMERLKQHGDFSFTSMHETYGVVAEEFIELGDALRLGGFYTELADLTVACVFGLIIPPKIKVKDDKEP